MSGTAVRVSSNQWRVLGAAESAYPDPISVGSASRAVGDGMPLSAHKGMILDLIECGLLEHRCAGPTHPVNARCVVVITEYGAMARLGRDVRAAVLA
jgi:hypothetical protein